MVRSYYPMKENFPLSIKIAYKFQFGKVKRPPISIVRIGANDADVVK